MHLNASLPQHLLKEWLALYPDSSLTGKRLLEIFETHSISSVINDLPKKSNRGRKRKVNPSEAVSQPLPSPTKKTKSSPSEFEVNNGVIEVISEASHEDRQWTTAMLCNLMFCNKQAEIKKTTLETEWQLLYPNSLLSARNLKSRFTVYQRTHSEKSTPKKPTKEKKPKTNFYGATKDKFELVCFNGNRTLVWDSMIEETGGKLKCLVLYETWANPTQKFSKFTVHELVAFFLVIFSYILNKNLDLGGPTNFRLICGCTMLDLVAIAFTHFLYRILDSKKTSHFQF